MLGFRLAQPGLTRHTVSDGKDLNRAAWARMTGESHAGSHSETVHFVRTPRHGTPVTHRLGAMPQVQWGRFPVASERSDHWCLREFLGTKIRTGRISERGTANPRLGSPM